MALDGVFGDFDNFPTIANPQQGDLDGNGIGDACDGAGASTEADLATLGIEGVWGGTGGICGPGLSAEVVFDHPHGF